MEGSAVGSSASASASHSGVAVAAGTAVPSVPYVTMGRAPRERELLRASRPSESASSSAASAFAPHLSSLRRAAARGRLVYLDRSESDMSMSDDGEEGGGNDSGSSDEAAAEAAQWARGEGRPSMAQSEAASRSLGAHEDLLQRLRALRRVLGASLSASSMVLHMGAMHSPPPVLAATPLAGAPAPAPRASSPPAAAAAAAPASASAAAPSSAPQRRRRVQLHVAQLARDDPEMH